MESSACPCCGQTLPVSDELIVDAGGIVVRRGRFATLTQNEHSILLSLQQAAPRIRSKEQLLVDLYWDEHEEPEIKIIDVWICKLRKKLRPLGVKIDTVWGRGYRLLPVAERG